MAKAVLDIRSFARQHTRLAVNTLASIARAGKSESARVGASVALLERGWGKPQQDLIVDGNINVTIRKMLDDESELIDVTPQPLTIDAKP